MLYLYKKNDKYIYKRRIPNTKLFYIFNTNLKNFKKAKKIAIIFNRLTINLFTYIKRQKNLEIDSATIANLLDDYKEKAVKEGSDFEDLRHDHLQQLFKLKEDDPLLGEVLLNGADPKVIDLALKSFKNLALGNFNTNKVPLTKYGKQIISRSTNDLKQIFSTLRKDKNSRELLYFLSQLLKTESEILKIDHNRAKDRFDPEVDQIIKEAESDYINNESYTESNKKKHILITDLENEFLFSSSYQDYNKSALSDSQTVCSKVKKITELFIDYIKNEKKGETAEYITSDIVKNIYSIIIDIPKKSGNHTTSYNYYENYVKYKNTKYIRRAVSTIKTELAFCKNFYEYLNSKNYFSHNDHIDIENTYKNILKRIDKMVNNGELKDEQNRVPFKKEMIKDIFDVSNKPYSLVYNYLSGKTKLRKNSSIDVIWARYYVPLIMFFTGTRTTEMSYLKIGDCELRKIKNKEVLAIYVEENEKRGVKSKAGRRIILIHNFLANDLGLIKYLKKAISEKREYLFNDKDKIEVSVGKEFNRDKSCIENHLTKEDDFNNSTYSLYSFRHSYRTHMENKNINHSIINKLMGHAEKGAHYNYLSITDEVYENVNKFDLHKSINWYNFKDIKQFI